MQCCCFSADVATRMLPATDLRLLIGILLPGQPKRQVLGVTSPHFFSSAQVYCCKKAFSASTGLLSNRVLPGGLHLTATHRKETKYRKKNQTFAGRGEAPALPEVLSGLCLGLAACGARIRPWLPHRAASQDRVEVSSGCGAT